MKKPSDDEDDTSVRYIYRTGFGEIAIVAVAACCTLAFALMMILPSPFAKYERAQAQQAKDARAKALAAPIPGGEVSVGISPAKH
jgi:hypothetical protein